MARDLKAYDKVNPFLPKVGVLYDSDEKEAQITSLLKTLISKLSALGGFSGHL